MFTFSQKMLSKFIKILFVFIDIRNVFTLLLKAMNILVRASSPIFTLYLDFLDTQWIFKAA